MPRIFSGSRLLWLSLLLIPGTGFGADEVRFGRDIKPLLARRCFSCHGPDEAESGLRFDKEQSAKSQLESGATAIVGGKPEQSELLKRVRSQEEYERMPPEGDPLEPEEIALLETWIASGAKWEGHWAFEPIADAQPPQLSEEPWRSWATTDIDRFIAARLQRRGLKPNPQASRRTLIRRAYYDLIGLPPTAQEIAAFEQDESPDAWEALIKRLLAMPQYGERWGRHWLDLVRYAETNSFERDGLKPNAWKYRDYVIRSFNDDKPYDQFLLEQLAGDELPEVSVETMTATAFYRLGIWDDEPADPLLARYDELDDIVTVTGQGLLGLTLNCARCHDHKIDPVAQAEYYGMVAFFQGLTPYGTRGNQTANNQWEAAGPEVMAQRRELSRRRDQLRRETRKIEQQGIAKMSAEDQRATEGPERAKVLKEKLQDCLKPAAWEEYQQRKQALKETERELAALPPEDRVLAVAKVKRNPEPTKILMRGNPHTPGDEVQPHFPAALGGGEPKLPERPADARSSGRRLALARWIASDQNRLTSRVMVNRIWQFHFGRGIVESSNNFGLLGIPPTHPDLLDYLASRFMEDGWSLKRMHLRIMLSRAYQMSSAGNERAEAEDPSNQLFWRFNVRRLSAEEVRDSLLAVAGALNKQMYGPSIYPKISAEVLAGQSRPGSGWGNSTPEQMNRRSVYIHIKRSLVPTELAVFDFPETDRSCEARFVTIQPAQALTMLNSDFTQQQAQRLADRAAAKANGDVSTADGLRSAIAAAVYYGWSREPSDEDLGSLMSLAERLQQQHGASTEASLRMVCLAILNANEFMFVD